MPARTPRHRGLKRTALIVLALAVVGGGLYAGYRWTQTQYYVAANGDHVALYQGLSQNLGPVSLHSVERDHPDIRLEHLPEYQRSQVEDSISAGSLAEAEERVAELAEQAEACRLLAAEQEEQNGQEGQEGQNGQEPGDGKDGKDGGEGDATNPEAPPLTDRQQELARQCTR